MELDRPQPVSLLAVAWRLDQAGIPWAVFAGAAASAYGATRPITDVDILVPAAIGERLLALFPEGALLSYESGVLVLVLPDIEILAGLSLMDLDAQMAARLTRHEIAGLSVPLIPPEDNVLLKAMWGRGLVWSGLVIREASGVPHELLMIILLED